MIYDGEALDVLHTIELDKLYPLIRAQISFSQHLDVDRLGAALQQTGRVVPELFCRYEISTNEFHELPINFKQLIVVTEKEQNIDAYHFDFLKEPQIKLFIQPGLDGTGDCLTIFMSHILSDGAGFKQVLYLLAKNYRKKSSTNKIERDYNQIDLATIYQQLQAPIKEEVIPKRSDHPHTELTLQMSGGGPVTYHVGQVSLNESEFNKLKKDCHSLKVSINDALLGAYAAVLAEKSACNEIYLACPTDMRQFIRVEANNLLIANLTARYNLAIKQVNQATTVEIIYRVHQEMSVLKEQRQFLQSIQELIQHYQQLSKADLRKIVEQNYHLRPIAYTNLGIIDRQRLDFGDLKVLSCFLTGSFRKAPMFQLAASTFANRCFLAFNMIGSKADYQEGLQLVQAVKQKLLTL